MTVRQLINILSDYPQDADISIYDNEKTDDPYPYMPAIDDAYLSVKYSAMVTDGNGVYRVGNDIFNPSDAPLQLQSGKLVHIITHHGK